MKLIRTKGRGARETAALLASLEQRGGAALDTVLPAVRRIVAGVRRWGDRALFRYAAQFDGLDDPANLHITREEMASAWDATDPAMRRALLTAARQIRKFAELQMGTVDVRIDESVNKHVWSQGVRYEIKSNTNAGSIND